MKPDKKQLIIGAAVLLVIAGGTAYLNRDRLLATSVPGSAVPGTNEIDIPVPELPSEPKDADERVKGMYAAALKAHGERLQKPDDLRSYYSEGLEWKTVGEFATSDKNVYYTYAAFVYAEAAKKFPNEWVPYFNVGNMFRALGEFGRAEIAYKKSAEIAPNRVEHYGALIEIMTASRVKPNDDIKAYFRERVPQAVFDPRYLVLTYARYLLEQGENDEALAILREAVERLPGDEQIKAEYEDVRRALNAL